MELPRDSRSSLFAVPFLVTNFFDFLIKGLDGTGSFDGTGIGFNGTSIGFDGTSIGFDDTSIGVDRSVPGPLRTG